MGIEIEQHKHTIRERIKKNILIPLGEELVEAYLDILQIKKVRKKQFVVQPGFVCREQIYVIEGAFRAFFIDSEGKEQTFQFGIEDWFIYDVRSHITGEPATIFVEALENSIVAYLPKEKLEVLYDTYPQWQKVARLASQAGFAYAQKRMMANLQKSAEERYQDFARDYPKIEQRVPRHALASYLNMTQEYLSKIRKKLMEADS